MRPFLLFCMVLMGVVTIWFGAHHFMSGLLKRVGDQGIQLALAGDPLTPQGAERVKESRSRALEWLDHRRSHVEIGIANLDQATQLPPFSVERAARLADASQALSNSLRLSPVQPVAWLLLAQIQADRSDWAGVASLLEMSLRTGHLLPSHARPRSILGIVSWFALDEPTIERLMASVAFMVEREPRLIAQLAADEFLEEEIAARLISRPEDGGELWRRFAVALQQETGVVLRPAMPRP